MALVRVFVFPKKYDIGTILEYLARSFYQALNISFLMSCPLISDLNASHL